MGSGNSEHLIGKRLVEFEFEKRLPGDPCGRLFDPHTGADGETERGKRSRVDPRPWRTCIACLLKAIRAPHQRIGKIDRNIGQPLEPC